MNLRAVTAQKHVGLVRNLCQHQENMHMEARNDSDAEDAASSSQWGIENKTSPVQSLIESKFVSIHLIIAVIQWPGSVTNLIFTAPFW